MLLIWRKNRARKTQSGGSSSPTAWDEWHVQTPGTKFAVQFTCGHEMKGSLGKFRNSQEKEWERIQPSERFVKQHKIGQLGEKMGDKKMWNGDFVRFRAGWAERALRRSLGHRVTRILSKGTICMRGEQSYLPWYCISSMGWYHDWIKSM